MSTVELCKICKAWAPLNNEKHCDICEKNLPRWEAFDAHEINLIKNTLTEKANVLKNYVTENVLEEILSLTREINEFQQMQQVAAENVTGKPIDLKDEDLPF